MKDIKKDINFAENVLGFSDKDKDSKYYRSRGFSYTWPALLRMNGTLIYKGKPYDILDITDIPDPDNKGFLSRKVLIADDLGNKKTIKLRASDHIWAK